MVSFARLRLIARRFARSLWFLPTLAVLAALGALVLTPFLDPFLPDWLASRISEDDVEAVLDILASGMLAVAIFSIGTMVSALQAAASQATPRTRPLLTEDRTAQTAISWFIGAFIFSVAGVVGLRMDLFATAGRVALFVLALGVIAMVVVVMVSWIERLSRMGGVAEVVDKVEAAARPAFAELAADPFGGGVPAVPVPEGAHAVRAGRWGCVQLIDFGRLGRLAEARGAPIHLAVRAGARLDPTSVIAHVEGLPDADTDAKIRSALVIGERRTFEHDPRFGAVVLAEIAARALSPAVNDPGTAIDVVAAQARLIGGWREAAARTPRGVRHLQLYVPPVLSDDLLTDAFRAIARDGGAAVEVGEALQKALAALARLDPVTLGPAAHRMSAEALARAEAVLAHAGDRAQIARLAADPALETR